MGLKFEVASIDEVPEALREHYAASEDGKIRLAVDGAVPKAKLDEFRTNNINLLRERDTYKTKAEDFELRFKDIDPDEYLKLKMSKGKGGKLTDEEIEAMLEDRVKGMKVKYDQTVNDLTGKLTAKEQRLSTLLIDNALQTAAITAGVSETAVDDVVRRGREIFKLKNDAVVPMEGEHIVYGDDGITPLSVKEWIGGLAGSAPHLFKQSSGGGANNGGGGGGPITVKSKGELKTVEDKSKFISEHGMDAYLKLPLTK